MPPGPPRAWARSRWCATGQAVWAPGWPMAAISYWVSRSGGAWRPVRVPGWLRWRCGCAQARCRRPRRCAIRWSGAACSGWAWPCCCAPARRWSGRGCTASRPRCRAMRAGCWVTSWGRSACNGWALPGQGWRALCWLCWARGWCSASPGGTWPRGWGHASMRWCSRAEPGVRWLKTWQRASARRVSVRRWCSRSAPRARCSTHGRCRSSSRCWWRCRKACAW